MFNLSVLDQKKSDEGGKTHLRKKTIKLIFGKVNEGKGIKKTLDTFLDKTYFFFNVFFHF